MRFCTAALGLLVCIGAATPVSAAIVQFDLQGNTGFGLLPGNENPGVTGGTGGEIGAGVSLDDVTNILTLNVGWGTGNGFTDLTGPATAMHIHLAPDASFSSNGGVEIGLNALAGFNADATNGGFNGSVNLSGAQVTNLLAGRFYVNVHTAANGGGEVRGNLVSAVPEPSGLAILGFSGLALGLRRRRK